MLLNGLGVVHDVTPFTQYLLAIGTTFILGSSGTDAIRTYRSDTISQSVRAPKDTTIIDVAKTYDPKHFDDGKI